jgi:hypothetical protein
MHFGTTKLNIIPNAAMVNFCFRTAGLAIHVSRNYMASEKCCDEWKLHNFLLLPGDKEMMGSNMFVPRSSSHLFQLCCQKLLTSTLKAMLNYRY